MSSTASPSPASPFSSGASISGQSSSSTVTPSSNSGGNRHRSRPSLAISYSQPPPSWNSVFRPSNPGIHDPVSPIGASTRPHIRPQLSTNAMSNPATVTSVAAGSGAPTLKQFVAPAHPQSHHLHSLPPREKTTRTLILDHTAWRQGRTRFAQGRCELGMKVKFKNGESSTERSDVQNGKRPGFYIGMCYKRPSDFGEPPEIYLASSDEDESSAFGDFDAERVCALGYGKRYRQKRREARQRARVENRMEVDSEEDADSLSDTDEEDLHAFTPSEDAQFAPLLAARAIGMDKVLHSMLIQRPSSPPRSPSSPPYGMQGGRPPIMSQSPQRSPSNSDMLPNGLRLRLSLATLVNGLFERQPSSTMAKPSDSDSKQTTATSTAPNTSLPASSLPSNTTPPGLAALAQVSSQPFYTPPTLPSFHTLSLPSSSTSGNTNKLNSPSPNSPHPPPFGGANIDLRKPPPLFSWSQATAASTSSNHATSTTPVGGTSQDNSTDRSPAIQPSRPVLPGAVPVNFPGSWTEVIGRSPMLSANKTGTGSALSRRAVGRSRDLYALGCYICPSSVKMINSFQRNVPTFSYRTATAPPKLAPEYPIDKLKMLCPRHLHEKCKICDPVSSSAMARGTSAVRALSTRIGAGLLRKEPRGGDMTGGVLADLLPRFLQLSALVAMELGREARGEEPELEELQQDIEKETASSDDTSSSGCATATFKLVLALSSHAQPTRAWFALLCGLITRAVLEGYVARGWKGAEYAEILMGVGLGIKGFGTRRASTGFGAGSAGNSAPQSSTEQVVDETKDPYEPDEMPNLIEACKLLFNGLVQDMTHPDTKDKATGLAEEEFVSEMEDRMSEFLTIPHATPDLATHLTGLSEKYPAEPIERAALRFCEAVAKWRGKPELEMYKISNKRISSKSQTSPPAPPPLSLNSLLASSLPNRPPIQHYFRTSNVARKPMSPPPRALKRQRSVDQDVRKQKKEKVGDALAVEVASCENGSSQHSPKVQAIPDCEWVGPYGV